MKNNEKKPTMIIVSTLFFNRIGNQSLLETVKQYARKYHIIFITSASKYNSYYMNKQSAYSELGDTVDIYQVYQIVPNFLRFFKKLLSYLKFQNKTTVVKKNDSSLQNMNYTKLNLLSAKVASLFLYSKLRKIINKNKPELVCAYEVFAVDPVIRLKRNYPDKKLKYLAKFQGTVLGFDYKNINNPIVYKKYKPDIEAFKLCKEFDVCAITNDGTNGKQVLEYFGVDNNSILYEPNGISKYIRDIKPKIRIDNSFEGFETINLFTLSRLIGWKRVYLSIEIINKLVNVLNNRRYFLNIYGYGTNQEIEILNNLIEKYSLHNFVCIHGSIEHDELINVYNKNHLMLSLYKYTNVTNPVIESIYLNKPIITLHDHNLDLLLNPIDSDRIFMYENLNDEDIINEISQLLNNTVFKFKNTNERAYSMFDWHSRIDTELNLLNR